jgi:hypothetical protein
LPDLLKPRAALRPVTVFARLSNVSVVITGIVGSIGIIIAHGTP